MSEVSGENPNDALTPLDSIDSKEKIMEEPKPAMEQPQLIVEEPTTIITENSSNPVKNIVEKKNFYPEIIIAICALS